MKENKIERSAWLTLNLLLGVVTTYWLGRWTLAAGQGVINSGKKLIWVVQEDNVENPKIINFNKFKSKERT